MIAIIGGIIQLLLLIFSKWAEKDAEKKVKKETLQKELTNAIKDRDISALNALTQRINRL